MLTYQTCKLWRAPNIVSRLSRDRIPNVRIKVLRGALCIVLHDGRSRSLCRSHSIAVHGSFHTTYAVEVHLEVSSIFLVQGSRHCAGIKVQGAANHPGMSMGLERSECTIFAGTSSQKGASFPLSFAPSIQLVETSVHAFRWSTRH
ncbi:unnamed protein product [Somion occarium]|uniref:Uncharacterized protein n=1 Tax=Somion occarium TaxID=3059160 RepID=A0ABP1DE49_9APHY